MAIRQAFHILSAQPPAAHKKTGAPPQMRRGPWRKEVGGALLSRAPERSIIAAGALNGRVRDGNGCLSPAEATNQRIGQENRTRKRTRVRSRLGIRPPRAPHKRGPRRQRASLTADQNPSGERVAALAPGTCQPGSLPGALRACAWDGLSSGGLGT